MFTLRQLKEFNTILLTDVEENTVLEYFNDLKQDKKVFDFFINEGVLKFKCNNVEPNHSKYFYFKVDEENKTVYLEFYIFANSELKQMFYTTIDFVKLAKNKSLNCKYNTIDKNVDAQTCLMMTNLFLASFIYFTYVLDNRETIIKTEKKYKKANNNISVKNKTASNSRRIINLEYNNVIYKLELDLEVAKIFKRSYKRHTESWSVRGYVRRLKSGKIIHVKPFVKGNKDVKIKPKTYKI